MKKLNNIKEIFSDFLPEYSEEAWLEIEKQLPKAKLSPAKKAFIGAGTGFVMLVTVITAFSVFQNNNENNIDTQNIKENYVVNKIETSENNSVTKTNNNLLVDNQHVTADAKNSSNSTINKNVEIEESTSRSISDGYIANNSNTTSETNPSSNIFTSQNTTNSNPVSENSNGNNTQKETVDSDNIENIIFTVEQIDNCVPAKVKFSAKNVPNDCVITWKTGDDSKNQFNGKNLEYTYNKSGTIKATAVVSKNNFVVQMKNLPEFKLFENLQANIIVEKDYKTKYIIKTDADSKNSYTWTINNDNFSGSRVEYDFEKDGNYKITLQCTNKFGCISLTAKTLNIKTEQLYYFPTAFIANSGGTNSFFGIIGEDLDFKQYTLLIKDFDGNLVFNSTDFNEKWNGKINNFGNDCPVGVYVWELKIVDLTNHVEIKKGKVNLFRQ